MFDYSEKIIKNNLVRGIADPEIMSNLLGDPRTHSTLEETVTFIAQKELGIGTKRAVGDSESATSSSPQTHQIQGCHYLNRNARHVTKPLMDKKMTARLGQYSVKPGNLLAVNAQQKGITQTPANVQLVVSGVIWTLHIERAVMVKVSEAHLNDILLKNRLKTLTMTMMAMFMTNYV